MPSSICRQEEMFNRSCINLTTLTKQRVRQWLGTIETVLFDADGVLWNFETPIAGAVEVFNLVHAMGKRNYLVTNRSTLSCKNILQKATKMGLKVEKSNTLSAPLALANYLASKQFKKKVLVVGDAGIVDELTEMGICSLNAKSEKLEISMTAFAKGLVLDPDIGAVVVGKDDDFDISKLITVCRYLQNQNVLFLGISLDKSYPVCDKRLIISSGPIIAAVKTMSERKPFILGKPNPWMLRGPINEGLINPQTTLMIGDTLETDMMFAHNIGCQSLLVGTGVSSMKDVDKILNSDNQKRMMLVPNFYLPNLKPFLEYLC